jgi:hypothetical protein
MWGWGRPEPGDWIRANRTIPVTLSDHLSGSGVRPGTKGVVLGRTGSYLVVRFDAGWGSHTARVRARDCSLHHRGRGEEAFARRTYTLTVVRMALALFLLWPVVWFVIVYLWQQRTVDGLLSSLAVAVAYGFLDYPAMVIAQPTQSVVYAAFLVVLGRVAFPRR